MHAKSNRKLNMDKAVIVYQSGIANVFRVTSFNMADYGREAARLIQADFRTCENFARGLRAAGVTIRVGSCNQAGDIANSLWTAGVEDCPFRDSVRFAA
jgi:hypothetical protein